MARASPALTLELLNSMDDEALLEFHMMSQSKTVRDIWIAMGKPGASDTVSMLRLREKYMEMATPNLLITLPPLDLRH